MMIFRAHDALLLYYHISIYYCITLTVLPLLYYSITLSVCFITHYPLRILYYFSILDIIYHPITLSASLIVYAANPIDD